MSDSVLIKRESLVAMADAVREATGETGLLTLDKMKEITSKNALLAKGIVEKTISSLVIPEGITSIGNWLFYFPNASTAITSVTFPKTITSIGTYAFFNCNKITFNVPWAEGEVAGAPWGALSATINYNYNNSGGA